MSICLLCRSLSVKNPPKIFSNSVTEIDLDYGQLLEDLAKELLIDSASLKNSLIWDGYYEILASLPTKIPT
jgi:hypothetical protein